MAISRKRNCNPQHLDRLVLPGKAEFAARIDRRNTKLLKGGEATSNLIVTNSGFRIQTEIHPIDRRLAELGQKRSWLARKTGISVGHIGAICRREARLIPGSAVQGKLCWALNLDLNQILGLKTTGQKIG